MPYVYRYIDLRKAEVIYVGKVTGDTDIYFNPLKRRHQQHRHENWYKDRNEEDLILQFIETKSHVDADIFESWLISYYDTGQLENKAKTGWGQSNINLGLLDPEKWSTFNEYELDFKSIEQATEYAIGLTNAFKEQTKDIDIKNKIGLQKFNFVHEYYQRQMNRCNVYRLRMYRLEFLLARANDFRRSVTQ